MSRKRKNQENEGGSQIFEKIGLLSSLTQAMTNEDLQAAFQALGKNGDRLYEIFAEAVYDEIEYLMKGEQEEAPQVISDAAQSAQQIYNTMQTLYTMMVSLGNSNAMQALNLIAQRIGGQTFDPGYNAPQPQYQPQSYQPPAPQPQYQQPQQPQYQQPAPQPQYQQPAQQPQQAPQQPLPVQRPARTGRYGESAPAQQPGPQQPQGKPGKAKAAVPPGPHGPPAATLPPRRNSVTGLF